MILDSRCSFVTETEQCLRLAIEIRSFPRIILSNPPPQDAGRVLERRHRQHPHHPERQQGAREEQSVQSPDEPRGGASRREFKARFMTTISNKKYLLFIMWKKVTELNNNIFLKCFLIRAQLLPCHGRPLFRLRPVSPPPSGGSRSLPGFKLREIHKFFQESRKTMMVG
jgi:hypothetical protein